MRCLIIGCGSIGSRRAKILAEMGHEVYGMDEDVAKAGEATGGKIVTVDELAENKLGEWDAILVCTPPVGRMELLNHVVHAAPVGRLKGLFVEKPLEVDPVALNTIVDHLIVPWVPVTMGACNMRFDERLSPLPDWVKDSEVVDFRMGQAAKHWSAGHQKVSLILDDIHELDLALWLRGEPSEVQGYSEEDSSQLKLTQEHGISWVTLDRITTPPVRLIASMRGDCPRINLWPPDPDMYRREMEHFLECVKEGKPTCNPLAQAAETLKWALEVVG